MAHFNQILNICALVLAAATLPLTLELWLLTFAFMLPKDRRSDKEGRSDLKLGIIVPAHNEELLIARCIQSLRIAASGSSTRIFTVAHNCSDRTAVNAAEAGSELVLYDDPSAAGKGFALIRGFDHALACGTDAVLVVDADSVVSPDLVSRVTRSLAGGAQAVQCRYEMEPEGSRPKTRLTALAFRAFNTVRPGGRNRLGLSSGIFGNGFAVRREILARHAYDALSVVEDLEYHTQLVLAGVKVEFLPDAVVTSQFPVSAKGEVNQRSRWEGGRARVARTWLAPLLKQVARGRLQLLEPALDLACLPIGYGVALYLLSLCIPIAWLQIYALCGLAALVVHVIVAAWVGPSFSEDMRCLLRAPAYIVWKLAIIPRLLKGFHSHAVWVRTDRHLTTLK